MSQPVPASSTGFPAMLDDAGLARTWHAAWTELGRPAPQHLQRELMTAWAEPQRHYHDQRHLRECLALWSCWRGLARRPADVALALWFHDAVYDPKADDNEQRSAAWAARALIGAGVTAEVAQRVYDLVMFTRHGGPGPERGDVDARLLLDIDLAILGAPAERFLAYDDDVRKEYGWVPGFQYRPRRAAVLRGFLARPKLYETPAARSLLEAQAKENLESAILRLQS